MQIIPITRTVGDTLTPLSLMLTDSRGDPISLAGKTVTFDMVDEDETPVITGGVCTAEPTQEFTIQQIDPDTPLADGHRVACVGHGYQDGWQIEVTSSGTLPAGLAAATRYFIINSTPNDFQLERRPGASAGGQRFYRTSGSLLDITTTGTGTHSMHAIGHALYDFQDAEVADPGVFTAAVKVDEGGEVDSYPGGNAELQITFKERL